MGCWNGTCGVTQLSIRSGDPIALFVLVQVDNEERHSNGFCYPTDIWSPIGLPVFGKYNDYGGIEDVEDTPNAGQILATLRKFAVPVPAPNKYRPGVEPEKLVDFEYFNEVTHEGNLELRDICHFALNRERHRLMNDDHDAETIKAEMERVAKIDLSYIKNTFTVGYMMVHRAVYDAMAKEHANWLTDKFGPTHRDVREIKKLIPALKERIASWGRLRESGSPPEIKDIVGSSSMIIRLAIEQERNAFSSFFTNYCVYTSQYHKGYADALVTLCMDEKPEYPWTLDSLIKGICEFMSFHSNMMGLRKFFTPQSGAGSQHENSEDYLRIVEVARGIITDRALSDMEFDD